MDVRLTIQRVEHSPVIAKTTQPRAISSACQVVLAALLVTKMAQFVSHSPVWAELKRQEPLPELPNLRFVSLPVWTTQNVLAEPTDVMPPEFVHHHRLLRVER